MTRIPPNTSSGCRGLTSLTLPNMLSIISEGAFQHCSLGCLTAGVHYRGGVGCNVLLLSITTVGCNVLRWCVQALAFLYPCEWTPSHGVYILTAGWADASLYGLELCSLLISLPCELVSLMSFHQNPISHLESGDRAKGWECLVNLWLTSLHSSKLEMGGRVQTLLPCTGFTEPVTGAACLVCSLVLANLFCSAISTIVHNWDCGERGTAWDSMENYRTVWRDGTA